METSVETRKIIMPTIKDYLKEDMLEERGLNLASCQELQEKIENPAERIDKPLENVREPRDKIDKTQEKIDRLQEKILIFRCGDKTQVKINKLQKKIKKTQQKIDKQQEKINKRQEKVDEPLEKIKEPLEKIDKPSEAAEESQEKIDREINKQQEKIGKPQHKINKTQEKIDKLLEKIKRTQEKIEKHIKMKEERDQDTTSCETCRYVKSKTCGSVKPGLRCKKTRRVVVPSVSSLNQSVSYNCRNCCVILGELCKELHATFKGDSTVRVCEVLKELSGTILAIANDCALFVRRIGIDASLMICRVVRRARKCANAKVSSCMEHSTVRKDGHGKRSPQ